MVFCFPKLEDIGSCRDLDLNVDSLARLVIPLTCLQSCGWHILTMCRYTCKSIFCKGKIFANFATHQVPLVKFNRQLSFPNLVIYLSNFYRTLKFYPQSTLGTVFLQYNKQKSYEELWKTRFFTLCPNYRTKPHLCSRWVLSTVLSYFKILPQDLSDLSRPLPSELPFALIACPCLHP